MKRLAFLRASDNDQVAIDFMSIYQRPTQGERTEEQTASFKRGLKALDTIYVGSRFRTLVVTHTDDERRPYETRVWPLFELVISAFSGNLLYDDPQVMSIIVDKFFLPNLAKRKFTNGKEDRALVGGLFRSLLYERAGMAGLDTEKDVNIAALKEEIKQLEAGTTLKPPP